ncbi:hypothetical protein GJ496_007377 [Pomphorhynchus laevis]|nr:hypothetical protein GJ496_007377 [Pomphorhynchus laevis]
MATSQRITLMYRGLSEMWICENERKQLRELNDYPDTGDLRSLDMPESTTVNETLRLSERTTRRYVYLDDYDCTM